MKKKQSASKFGGLPSLLAAFFIILITGVYFYSRVSVSGLEIDIVTLSERVRVGESFDIKLGIKNNFKDSIKDIDLSINLPEDAILSSGQAGTRRLSLGDIGALGSHEEIIRVIVLPSASEYRELSFSLSYMIEGLSATFEKTESIKISVEELPIETGIVVPKEVVSNEDFEIGGEYLYRGIENLNGLKFKLDYPEVFTVKSSSIKPDINNNNSWLIGSLKTDDVGAVSVTGSIDLPEGSEFTLTAGFYMTILGEDYPITQEELKVKVLPSPLSVSILLDQGNGAVFSPGDTLNYRLRYKNSSVERYSNLVLTAKLSGQMYATDSIQSDGALWNAISKTITWSHNTLPRLNALSPGEEGEVSFSVRIADNYPIRRLNDKNFTARVDARLEAIGSAGSTKISSGSLENKISGRTEVDAEAFFRDAESLILNGGSLPPRVGENINFTVHWKLKNFSTDVTQVEVRAVLGPDVVFTGITKGTSGQIPIYDPITDEVVWRIDKIFATTGITGPPLETVFQIRVKPPAQYVGNYMPILGETRVTAKDEFTGLVLTDSDNVLTTRLEDDMSVGENDGRVVQ